MFPGGILSAILAVGLIVPLLAFAELSNDTLLGPDLRWRPAYDGSTSQRVEFVPVVRYFGHPWFVRSTQGVLDGGVRMELAPGLHAGEQLAYEPGREKSESDFLNNHNVSDINRGASIGAHLEWDSPNRSFTDYTARSGVAAHRLRSRRSSGPPPQRKYFPKRPFRRRRIYAGYLG